jgi:hypothetical protein
MAGKIAGFLREYVAVFSNIITIIGFYLFFMGVSWYWIRGLISPTKTPIHFIYTLGEWNAYTLTAGLIILGIGLYYIYSFLKKRKFVMDELKSDKRSEILRGAQNWNPQLSISLRNINGCSRRRKTI